MKEKNGWRWAETVPQGPYIPYPCRTEGSPTDDVLRGRQIAILGRQRTARGLQPNRSRPVRSAGAPQDGNPTFP